nr:zeatin o-glucosyltransferase [Quercus suber]
MANQQQHQNHGLNKTKVAVVMVPFPAQGHLNQLLHLSRLILAYNIPVHYACTATHNRQAMLRVHGWDPNSVSDIHFHDFKIPPFLTPSPNPNAPNKFPSHLQPLFNASLHLRDPMASLLHELSSKATRIIVINDSLTGSVVQDLVTVPNAESYTFQSISAFTCFFNLWEAMGKALELDPYSKIITKDLPFLEGCLTTEFMNFIDSQVKFQKLSSGYLYNTCRVIEGAYMDLMEKIEGDRKHWAIGPFNPVRNIGSNKRHKCLEWLDKESPNSVIYVSFGTTTAMEDEQIKELAIGLEKSEQKFIWVLRDADKEKAVKLLMASEEGDEIRKRTVDLGGAIGQSIEEGGVSRMELDSFITHITR